MSLKIALALTAAVALAPLTALAQDSSNQNQPVVAGSVNKVDSETFLTKVPSSNAFEIESSRLALEKASNDQVKQFAQMMIDDHTKAGEAFKAAVEKSGRTMPGDALEERHQQMLETLSGQDQNFDAAYVQAQFQAHNEAVSLFSAYAGSGDDEALRAFAVETLPKLEQHLAAVQQLPGAPVDATSSTMKDGATPEMNHGSSGSDGTTPAPQQ
jgi:putative membrane protein